MSFVRRGTTAFLMSVALAGIAHCIEHERHPIQIAAATTLDGPGNGGGGVGGGSRPASMLAEDDPSGPGNGGGGVGGGSGPSA